MPRRHCAECSMTSRRSCCGARPRSASRTPLWSTTGSRLCRRSPLAGHWRSTAARRSVRTRLRLRPPRRPAACCWTAPPSPAPACAAASLLTTANAWSSDGPTESLSPWWTCGRGVGWDASGARQLRRTLYDLACDRQTRLGAAPERPRAAAPRPRPDRPGVRAAAGRRGARPRRAHVGRAPQPRVQGCLRRVAVLLPDDAAHRARDGAAASWRPQRHRGLLRGRLRVAGHLQHSLHRTGRHAAQHLPEPGSRRGGGDAAVRGQTGDQAGQESRSAGHRPAASLKGMDITIHASVLPHDDPDASLAFYRDILGFEVRTDVGKGTMRWITVGPAGQPSTSILLAPPAVGPGFTDDERRTIAEMMAKGTYGWILLATKDLDDTFERVQASNAEVVQEPA